MKCPICPHECFLKEGSLGICGVRTFDGKMIKSLNYGKATALALDPIVKKPLAHFYPEAMILSYGSFGCNLDCSFCQNSTIAAARADSEPPTQAITSEKVVETALSLKPKGNIGIAYTYNEPFVGWEFMRDTARLAHAEELLNIAITNGYVASSVWQKSLSFLDAVNIDLKCFSDKGYQSLGAPKGLEVVKSSIQAAYNAGVHTEVTTLIVPGFSDDEKLFEQECAWLASLSPDIPLHISRFFPCHKDSHKKPTDRAVLDRFYHIAQNHLNNILLGNI